MSATTQRTILIVDDEENLARLLEMNLRRHGYRIVKAEDGVDGLKAAAEYKPDLIISDVNMPHVDGFEMLQRLKADEELKDTPVIMLTARSRNEDLWHGVESGAEYYVTKPVDLPGLINLVTKVFAERDAAGSSAPASEAAE
jgi:two-component system alkaline phosphatase synthesis response regulator PhoP